MNAITINTWVNNDCTIGRLEYRGFRCLTLELPWRGNQRNISCIQAGTYSAKLYDSPKHGRVILIEDVNERSWIEVHAGNHTSDIKGCILVGSRIGYTDSDGVLDITNSRNTLDELISLLPETFTIEIRRNI